MLNELRVDELLEALGERTPAPASGAATALTAALAAALAELASRYAGDDAAVTRARELRSELVRLGDEDAAAYAAFMADRGKRRATIDVPERIAGRADEVAAIAGSLELRSAVRGDAEAAVALAEAAAAVARRLAALNAES
jgi:formiminotetrahydrofolate cyclodeaminase